MLAQAPHRLASAAAKGILAAVSACNPAASTSGAPAMPEYPPDVMPSASGSRQSAPEKPAPTGTAVVHVAELPGGDQRYVAKQKNCCKGSNDCKGKGMCKTDKHACKGMNQCKAQGGCRPPACP